MTIQMKIAAIAVIAAFLPAACGGGGGGGGGSSAGGGASASPFDEVRDPMAFAAEAGSGNSQTFVAAESFQPDTGAAVTGESAVGLQDAEEWTVNFLDDVGEATVAFEDERHVYMRFTPEGGFESRHLIVVPQDESGILALLDTDSPPTDDDPITSVFTDALFFADLEYSVMGVWAEDAGDLFVGGGGNNRNYDPANFRPFYLGDETANADIPTSSVGAGYDGDAFGIYAADGGNRYFLFSNDVEFVANFRDGTIDGEVVLHAVLPPELLDETGALPMPDNIEELTASERTALNAAGMFPLALFVDFVSTNIGADGAFSGDIRVLRDTTNDGNPAVFGGLGVTGGTYKGRFYGPEAEELAGVAEAGGGAGQDTFSLGFIAQEEE